MFMKKIIYKDLPFVDPNRRIYQPQTCVFQKPPLTSISFLTSLGVLEKPIAHKGPDKLLSWIQNPGVRPIHEILRLVNMKF
jgi:hypothetical protein